MIAETLAQNYRDFAKGHGATELEMYDDPNGCSKFMIVVEDANTAATLRKHLAAVSQLYIYIAWFPYDQFI